LRQGFGRNLRLRMDPEMLSRTRSENVLFTGRNPAAKNMEKQFTLAALMLGGKRNKPS
jgi:hypothetical protein